MEYFSMLVLVLFVTMNAKSTKEEYPKSDELTLRNQLLADVYFLKEGVDKLLISSEVLNKRFTNQMDVLKTFQNILNNNHVESEEVDTNCDKLTSIFNATLRKQNVLETRLIVKLEEMHENQMANFEEMLIKLRLNKSCGTQTVSSNTLALLSSTLNELSEKIEQFEEKLIKLTSLEKTLNAQQTKFDQVAANQMKILQEINLKLGNYNEQFDKINEDLTSLRNQTTDLKNIITRPRPKLPMEVILGLTSANVTNFK